MSTQLALPLDAAHALLSSFHTFLLVSLHNLLYYRNLYPATTFLSTRAYALPVHQSRHPKVCAWLKAAVDAVAAELAEGRVGRVGLVVHMGLQGDDDREDQGRGGGDGELKPKPGAVLERWMFDTSHFPRWPGGAQGMRDHGRMLSKLKAEEDESSSSLSSAAAAAAAGMNLNFVDGNTRRGPAGERPAGEDTPNWFDVDEQLRGAVRRMAGVAEGMQKLPDGCTFTVAVELREDEGVEAPIGHPQLWIPSQPSLQPPPATDPSQSASTNNTSNNNSNGTPSSFPFPSTSPHPKHHPDRGADLGGVRTAPLRSVEAGPLFFECWVEEGRAKLGLEGGRNKGKGRAS